MVWASIRKKPKSWPMTCVTRGPAQVMALTEDTRATHSMALIHLPPASPKTSAATMCPISIWPASSAVGTRVRKAQWMPT